MFKSRREATISLFVIGLFFVVYPLMLWDKYQDFQHGSLAQSSWNSIMFWSVLGVIFCIVMTVLCIRAIKDIEEW